MDYCRYSTATTILALDRTTKYDQIDRDNLHDGMQRLYSALAVGERLLVYTVSDAFVHSERIFDACYPGCPENSLGDWLFGDCTSLKAAHHKSAFQRQLATVIDNIMHEPEDYHHSDLIQTFAALTRRHSAGNGLKRFVAFTDLLENSQHMPWPQILQSEPEMLLKRLRKYDGMPDLSGASVHVFGIGRSHGQARSPLAPDVRERLISFWSRLFKAGGAEPVHIGFYYR
jgi:hypothetical protein